MAWQKKSNSNKTKQNRDVGRNALPEARSAYSSHAHKQRKQESTKPKKERGRSPTPPSQHCHQKQ
jgi:hypothetical protein